MSDLGPVSGVERKLDFGVVKSGFDPSADITTAALYQLPVALYPLTELGKLIVLSRSGLSMSPALPQGLVGCCG
jgi:hypothetical protein